MDAGFGGCAFLFAQSVVDEGLDAAEYGGGGVRVSHGLFFCLWSVQSTGPVLARFDVVGGLVDIEG